MATPDERRRKVMVLGLDGLTLDLLRPWVAAGHLPAFARLLSSGAHGVLRSVTNMATGPTWASFATGCSPCRHGVLHDYHHRRDRYALRPTSGADVLLPAFWQLASDAGRSVIVLNPPYAYPARPLRGVLLCGIDAPSETAPGFCYPPDAYRQLRRVGIDYAIDAAFQGFMQAYRLGNRPEAVQRGIAAVRRETENRTRAAEYFLAQGEWDLLVAVYSLPDVLRQPGTQAQDGLILEGYRWLDEQLDRLLAYLPPDGVVIVASDHGFGPATGSAERLNGWLAQQGWLRWHRQPTARLSAGLWRQVLRTARRYIGFRLRQRLLATVPGLRAAVMAKLSIGHIDWSGTTAYAALDHSELWLNVRGRQPLGIVMPEDQAEIAERIAAALRRWQDPVTGRPYVRQVTCSPHVGVELGDTIAPDLLLERDTAAVPPQAHPTMSGDHAPEGAIVIAGGGIRPSELPPAQLPDLAAIVLKALAVAPPAWMEGQAADGLLD